MLKELVMSTLKANYSNGTWSEDYINEMATNYQTKGIFTDDDITELEEFMNPTEEEQSI